MKSEVPSPYYLSMRYDAVLRTPCLSPIRWGTFLFRIYSLPSRKGELTVRNRKVQEILLLPGEFGGVPQIGFPQEWGIKGVESTALSRVGKMMGTAALSLCRERVRVRVVTHENDWPLAPTNKNPSH